MTYSAVKKEWLAGADDLPPWMECCLFDAGRPLMLQYLVCICLSVIVSMSHCAMRFLVLQHVLR